jgi:hypothetical protein
VVPALLAAHHIFHISRIEVNILFSFCLSELQANRIQQSFVVTHFGNLLGHGTLCFFCPEKKAWKLSPKTNKQTRTRAPGRRLMGLAILTSCATVHFDPPHNFIYFHYCHNFYFTSNDCLSVSIMETRYNNIGLYDTSPIQSDFLWYKLTLHC